MGLIQFQWERMACRCAFANVNINNVPASLLYFLDQTLNFLAALFFSLMVFAVPAMASAVPISVTEMFSSSKTIEGDSFDYPSGKAEMRLVRVEFEEGAKFLLHLYATPSLGYIEKGELTLSKQDGTCQSWGMDKSSVLGPKTPAHTMGNTGKGSAVMWVTFAATEDLPNLDLAS